MDHLSVHRPEIARRGACRIVSAGSLSGGTRARQASFASCESRRCRWTVPLCTALKWHGVGRAEFCLSRHAERGEASEASKLRILLIEEVPMDHLCALP